MSWNPEIETTHADDLTYSRDHSEKTYTGELALEYWNGDHNTCNDFAFSYQEAHENVTVKVAEINGVLHCYAYDHDRDWTIDATLGQFEGCPSVGLWDGDEHPYLDERQPAPDEYEDEESFREDYEGVNSPFYL